MFRSPFFTAVGVLSLLLIIAAITLQIMELDSYEMVEPVINKVLGK